MKLKKRLHIALLACALLFTHAYAASADTEEPVKKEQTAPAAPKEPTPSELPLHTDLTTPQPVVSPSYEGALVKMIVTVVGLIFFVFLTVWVLRRMGQGKFRGFGSNRSIQVIERKPLSPKSMLYLVQVGHQKFLIAESQLEVRRLGMIEELSETASDETT